MPLLSTDSLTQGLRVPPQLALDFFIAFARFEYALIAIGFVHDRRGVAEPDWNCFFTFIEQLDNTEFQPVLTVGQHLIASPPKKLVLDGQKPRFRPVHQTGQSDIRFLLQCVKQARHNLFHGGKFLTGPQPVERNESVVSDSLAVLRAVLEAPSLVRLRDAYDVV